MGGPVIGTGQLGGIKYFLPIAEYKSAVRKSAILNCHAHSARR